MTVKRINLLLFRIAARYLAPVRLDMHEICSILASLGYEIVADLPPRRFKMSLAGSGIVARRRSVMVDVNSDSAVIGVSAGTPQEVVEVVAEFDRIEQTLRENIDALQKPCFYEVLSEYEVSFEGISVIDKLRSYSTENPLSKALSNLLGRNLYSFSYRLTGKDMDPCSTEWIDIEIMPSPRKPYSTLYIAIVYRTQDKTMVIDGARKIIELPKVVASVFLES